MDADDVIGVVQAQRSRDRRAPVAALGAVVVVAQAGHEGGPGVADVPHAPSRFARLVAPAVAGQGRAHDMEGVRGVAAMGLRVRQRTDDIKELHHRSGPPVRKDQREGVGVRGRHMDVMNPEAVDRGAILRELVDAGLAGRPVVLFGPVAAELFQDLERDALAPITDGFGFRPASAPEALAEIVDLRVGNVQSERLCVHQAPLISAPNGGASFGLCAPVSVPRPYHMARQS